MIYFIQDEMFGAVKIGFTAKANPLARLAELQTGNSRKLHLITSFPGSRDAEAKLHEIFSQQRVSSEWFSDSPYLRLVVSVLTGFGDHSDNGNIDNIVNGIHSAVVCGSAHDTQALLHKLALCNGAYKEFNAMTLWVDSPKYLGDDE